MSATPEVFSPGLEGVIAGETHVSSVEQGSLSYRGYNIADLAEHASFEECAFLLLHGELPTAVQLAQFRGFIDEQRPLAPELVEVLRKIPSDADTMDLLRTMVSYTGHLDQCKGQSRTHLVCQATRILAQVPGIVAARMRLQKGQEPLAPQAGLSHAGQFLYQAFGRAPSELEEKILNLTLILYAEHEFNASTFAARVITSTMSDMYSAVVGAIGALKGPLHGGANEEAIHLINRFKSGPEARQWVLDAIAAKNKIMGFGHRVYKNGDHRAHILERYVRPLGEKHAEGWKADVYFAIKDTVWEQKKLFANVDFPCGMVYYFLHLPIEVYTPIFVASRVSGWCAHVIEQAENNRLIRPRSRYVGPPERKLVPLAQR